MRALLLCPELPPSFWSFADLVDLHEKKTLGPPLGLLTVAAMLPKTWDLRLVDLNIRRPTEADWAWADIVLISAMLVQREPMVALIREAKRRGKRVLVGGPYPTTMPEDAVQAGADYVVQGEAEEIIGDVCRAVEAGAPHQVFSSPRKPDVSLSPIPRYDLVNLHDYWVLAVQTSRGCPYDCEFCDVIQIYGRRPRYKSAEQTILELDALYKAGGRGDVFLCDDNFIGNRREAVVLLKAILEWQRKHRFPFHFETQATLNLADDEEVVDLMVKAAFRFVVIGVETPDEKVLATINKKHNLRIPMLESLDRIRSRGLDIIVNMVVGFDNEQAGAGKRVAAFIEAASVPVVYLSVLQALPTTKFWDRLEREGRLLADRTTGQTTGGQLNFVTTRSHMEIFSEYIEAMNLVYKPANYFRRAYENTVTRTKPPEPSSAPKKKRRIPEISIKKLKFVKRELPLLRRLLWRRGVQASFRHHFWFYLARVLIERPDRTVHFLDHCAAAEDMFRARDMARTRAEVVFTQAQPSSSASSSAHGHAPKAEVPVHKAGARRLPVIKAGVA